MCLFSNQLFFPDSINFDITLYTSQTHIKFNGNDISTSPKYKHSPKYKTYFHDNEQIHHIQFHVGHSKVHT